MSANLLFPPVITAMDDGGLSVPGAELFAFVKGTTTAAYLYTDETLQVPHARPVVADAAGRFPAMYYNSSSAPDTEIRKPTGELISPKTGLPSVTGNGVPAPLLVKGANTDASIKSIQRAVCVLRSTAPGQPWDVIDDASHKSINFADGPFTVDINGALTVPLEFDGLFVGAAQVTADESYASLGVTFGASVGTDNLLIRAYKDLSCFVNLATNATSAHSFFASTITCANDAAGDGSKLITHPDGPDPLDLAVINDVLGSTGYENRILAQTDTSVRVATFEPVGGTLTYDGATLTNTSGNLNPGAVSFASNLIEVAYPSAIPSSFIGMTQVTNMDDSGVTCHVTQRTTTGFKIELRDNAGSVITSLPSGLTIGYFNPYRIQSATTRGSIYLRRGRVPLNFNNIGLSSGNIWVTVDFPVGDDFGFEAGEATETYPGETTIIGKSAYESWLDLGNTGTEADFIEAISGESAYAVWLAAGNVGTEADYLADLEASAAALAQPILDDTETARDAALAAKTAAETAETNAAASAATVASAVEPVRDHENEAHLRALRRGGGWLVSNTANHLRLQADGTYLSAGTSWAAEWDFAVTGGASFTADWVDVSGVTMTVEERDATTQIVAPVTVTTTATRRQYTATANASTTIVRVKLSGPSSGTSLTSPSVTEGKPETVPSNPDYLSLLLDKILEVDGADLSAGIGETWNNTGSINSTDGQTVDVAAGTNFYVNYNLSTAPAGSEFIALIELGGPGYVPRTATLTPIAADGTSGTAIEFMKYRWGEDRSRFLVRIPSAISGSAVVQLQLAAYSQGGGGPNVGLTEAMTFTLTPYNSPDLPAFRTLPTSLRPTINSLIDAKTDTLKDELALIRNREDYEAVSSDDVARAITARIHASNTAEFWISADGDDANGGEAWSPKLTSETATAALSTGRGALHRRGDTFSRLGQSSGSYEVTGAEIGAYGSGPERPMLDSRVPLSSLTWTADGSGWTVDVTLTQTAVMSGPNADNTTHFYLSDCRASEIGSKLDWEVGGASIAANKTSVDSNGNAFTIWRTGSTTQDPRSDSNSTTYTLYLNIGEDPNGLDLRLAQRSGPLKATGGGLRDLIFIGGCGKDANSTDPNASGPQTEIENLVALFGSSHAIVGPNEMRGVNQFAVGAPTPVSAATTDSVLDRSRGAAVNNFTAVDLSSITIKHSGVTYAGDARNAFYFHTSGNDGYLGWEHGGIMKAFNSGNAFKFDAGAVGAGGVIINRLESGPVILPATGEVKDGCDFFCDTSDVGAGGEVIIRSGFHTTGLYTRANSGGVALASREAVIRIGQWGGFQYTPRFNIGAASVTTIDGVVFDNLSANILVANTANISGQRPVFHLYGWVDNSPAGKPASLRRVFIGGSDWQYTLNLHLHSATLDEKGEPLNTPIPCVLGDIADNASVIPNKLFVDEGQTFGLFNRTRAEIRTALAGAGLTATTDYIIDDETWIVNREGAIIDVPVSLGGST